MSTRKLNEEERESPMSKIILLCSEITYQSQSLNHLCYNYETMLSPAHEISMRHVMEESLVGKREVLDEVVQGLFAVREKLIDYLNAVDAVGTFDTRFGNLIFNAVNDEEEVEEGEDLD